MVARFINSNQQKLYDAVLSGLDRLGYGEELLRKNYTFEDWFSSRSGQTPEIKTVDVAAFGRSPLSYDSACFAVAVANGSPDVTHVSRYRALGAPLAFMVEPNRVLLWKVQAAAAPANSPLMILTQGEVEGAFRENGEEWRPANLLRAKNIGPIGARQLDFIDAGLIPAIEQNVLEKLDPLLRSTFFAALGNYQVRHSVTGRPDWLFRLVFRVLAGKVMTDRRLTGFERFVTNPDPNELLDAVNHHFGDSPHLNADDETRQLIVERFWGAFSFMNMSVPVLSHVWENTLVDKEVREELSIHGTPPSVARYIVKRLAFDQISEGRMVVEPCCGSATFLLAAMRQISDSLPISYTATERHDHLRARLAGFDIDTFGLEVARDCLMLADYPVSDHWVLKQEDVFASAQKAPTYHACLRNASVVLCNPPFSKFSPEAKKEYKAKAIFKPVELVGRILDLIPADCVLGLVMPHVLLTGKSYPEIRQMIAKRFGLIELVNLPDQNVFSSAEYETVILIARDPRKTGISTQLLHGKVGKQDWSRFVESGIVPNVESLVKRVKEARSSLAAPDLQAVWHSLRNHKTIQQVTDRVHRGIAWNVSYRENGSILLSDTPKEGYILGIPPSPKTEFNAFLPPRLKYLNFLPGYRRRNAFDLPWDKPKVLMTARRKGRSPWRLVAFADEIGGLTCYDTFMALWPSENLSPVVLAAVMNGPLASVYMATHRVGVSIPVGAVRRTPMPHLNDKLTDRIEVLVREYVDLATGKRKPSNPNQTLSRVLLEIDAAVLEGYNLPPRLERHLLDYFNGYGAKRPVNHSFEDYFPDDFKPTLPLHVYLSKAFQMSTVKNLLATAPSITDPELIAALEEVE